MFTELHCALVHFSCLVAAGLSAPGFSCYKLQLTGRVNYAGYQGDLEGVPLRGTLDPGHSNPPLKTSAPGVAASSTS